MRNLKRLGLRVHEYACGESRPNVRAITCYSKQLCSFLRKDLSEVKNFLRNKKLVVQFIKGFYESEGNYEVEERGLKKYARIRIYNTDKKLLELMNSLLLRLGFHFNLRLKGKGQGKRRDLYALDNRKQEEVTRFLRIIKPKIKC